MSKKKDSLKPWLSRPTVNRSVTLPLTRPLTQRLSNLNEFHPNELDPYLLFDAQDSMIGTLENPTLDLDPSKPDTLNVITATRAGTATYTDVNGNIATAPANTVRVDYTQGAELTPTKFQHVVQTDYSAAPNAGFNRNLTDIDGPDGASGGVRVSETAANGQHYLTVRNQEIVSGTTYTISFYIKEGSYSTVIFYTESARIRSNVTIDFSNSSIQLGNVDVIAGSEVLSNVGGGWYRVVYSATANGSGNMELYAVVKDLNSYAGDVNNFTDYYGFQVEEGTTASSFVANTTGSPKFITGATFGPRVPMILVEPSATNLVAYSEDFGISWWTKSGVSVVSEETSAPDGSSNVFKVVENTSNSTHSVFRNSSTVTLNAHSFSVFAKTNGRNLKLDFFGGTNFANFDLTSGSIISTAGSGLTASIEPIGGGWFRCSITQVQTSTTIYPNIFCLDDSNNISYQGDGTSGIYVWGAQLETGSVSTSVIPTSGSTVTRAADDLVISGSAFSDFYNQSEGTVYAETIISPSSQPAGDYLWSINDGGFTNRIVSVYDTSLYHYVIASNAINFVTTTAVSSFDEIIRSALSYKTNNTLHSVNGVTSTPDTSVTLPSNLNRLNLGQNNASGNHLNGHIKRLIYWPYHSDIL